MENLKIPKNYHSALNLHDTQIAIKTVKDFFSKPDRAAAEVGARIGTAFCGSPVGTQR